MKSDSLLNRLQAANPEPLIVQVGIPPLLKCTLVANALVTDKAETSTAAVRIKNLRECRIRFKPPRCFPLTNRDHR